MNPNYMNQLESYGSWVLPTIFVLAIWTFVIKGFALYRAGKQQQTGWFVAMFILNTLGILEALYFFVFSKKKSS